MKLTAHFADGSSLDMNLKSMDQARIAADCILENINFPRNNSFRLSRPGYSVPIQLDRRARVEQVRDRQVLKKYRPSLAELLWREADERYPRDFIESMEEAKRIVDSLMNDNKEQP